MFGVEWSDSQTLWLNLTNLALGLVTVAAVRIVAVTIIRDLVWKWHKARAFDHLDAEMRAMMSAGPAHVLKVPELGLTMADGGEPIEPSPGNTSPKNRK
jgi:hypothetical protein